MNKQYFSEIHRILQTVEETQAEAMDQLSARMAEAIRAHRNLYVFGCSHAGILAEDKLFATLDPTTRGCALPGGETILLTDTVGFIRKLPHHLIEAFKSTLEEARYSDILLHVADCSDDQMDLRLHVVYETLRELGIQDKIIITVFNKIDCLTEEAVLRDLRSDYQARISAKTGEGIEELKLLL